MDSFCRTNLDIDWRSLLDRLDAALVDRPDDSPVDAESVGWMALGPARLWHTRNTGEIVGKSRAGLAAAERWPDLADPITDAVDQRAGAPVILTAGHGKAAGLLGRRILAEAGLPEH